MEPEGRSRRHRRSKRLERVMWGRCEGAAYSVSIVGSSEGGEEEQKFCRSGPRKTYFATPQPLVDEREANNWVQHPQKRWGGYLKCPAGLTM